MNAFVGAILISLGFATINNSNAELEVRCLLNKSERIVILEAATRNTQEVKWVLNQTHGGTFQDRGFAKNLIGNSNNQLSVVTLIEQCTAPRTFDAFCEPVCDSTGSCSSSLEKCSQLGCEQAGVDTIKAWWKPAPIRYTTDRSIIPNFDIKYLTRPTVNFRFDARKEGVIDITWHAEDKVTAKADQNVINAGSFLKVSGRTSDTEPMNAHLEIIFPQIPGHKRMTHMKFDIDEHGATSGVIHVGSTVVGKITPGDEEQDPRITWSPECI